MNLVIIIEQNKKGENMMRGCEMKGLKGMIFRYRAASFFGLPVGHRIKAAMFGRRQAIHMDKMTLTQDAEIARESMKHTEGIADDETDL